LIKKFILPFTLLVAVLTSCTYFQPSSKKTINSYASFDLDSIRKRGKLIAVTDFNSTNYFIYKGEPMGFNYELLKSFSDHIGIDLEIVCENHLDNAFEMVKTGKADLLAIGLTVDPSGNKDILFTEPVEETRKVLVQRKPRNWRSLTAEALDKRLIRDQSGLVNKTVYLQSGYSYNGQLLTMAGESGDSISISKVPYDSEQLIKHVAEGIIDFSVCDENVALVNAKYYPDIDVSTPLSLPRGIAWGVRKGNSDTLLYELNRWITAYKKTGTYALLYAKYFKNSRSSIIVKSDFYALNTGKVSQYDDMIRRFSVKIDWDWRLLASLICQESHFDPDVESGAGAYGLMQIMPETGENFGIDITSSPENNMKAGIQYIKWLHTIFDPKIPDEKERINFILAAYNAGPGHVLDAMKLAEKNGMDPLIWNGSVAVWLQKKSEPKYFRDKVVKNGYFRGTESVSFVSEVLDRYEHYKNIIPEVRGNSF
jgi:membrane-bound lytic murein transglycosylase F